MTLQRDRSANHDTATWHKQVTILAQGHSQPPHSRDNNASAVQHICWCAITPRLRSHPACQDQQESRHSIHPMTVIKQAKPRTELRACQASTQKQRSSLNQPNGRSHFSWHNPCSWAS